MSLRRLLPVLATGLLWLAFAGVASADGGPHVAASNNGSLGLSSDNCAGCHRAHTAAGADLLRTDESLLCLSCHGGNGATTDVVDGWQYQPTGGTASAPTHGSTILGALRGGGIDYALIDSSNPARWRSDTRHWLGRVGVLTSTAKQRTTSTHLGTGTVWGNGADGTNTPGAGPANLECTSCHNPHGNGFYRILRSEPGEDFTTASVTGWHVSSNAVEVQDIAPCPALGCVDPTTTTRNYTVLPGVTAADAATYLASQGDYWRKNEPWNTSTASADPLLKGWDGQSPTNAVDAAIQSTTLDNGAGLMTAWCISCHTRYSGLVNGDGVSSSMAAQPDTVFTFRHLTMNYGCLQCHVSHGTNALAIGNMFQLEDPARNIPPTTSTAGPSGTTLSADSRLLKIDNFGTCEMCHDPTGTITIGSYTGPLPTPGVP